MTNPNAWTEERVELLKNLWAEGLSASQIANRLGEVTRNAVIGKVHRLGIPGRVTIVRKARVVAAAPSAKELLKAKAKRLAEAEAARRRAEMMKLAPKPEPEPDVVVVSPRGIALLDLKESMCRYPHGHPGDDDFHFCGARRSIGLPYCGEHMRLTRQPRARRPKQGKAQNVVTTASYDNSRLVAAE